MERHIFTHDSVRARSVETVFDVSRACSLSDIMKLCETRRTQFRENGGSVSVWSFHIFRPTGVKDGQRLVGDH